MNAVLCLQSRGDQRANSERKLFWSALDQIGKNEIEKTKKKW